MGVMARGMTEGAQEKTGALRGTNMEEKREHPRSKIEMAQLDYTEFLVSPFQ